MDIRNIKEQAPEISDGKYLEGIWALQKKLLSGYIGKIEKDLPMYPIDIHSHKGQQVLKDFSARVIEETAEGYESTSAALNLVEKYGYNTQAMSEVDFDMLLNHLQNSNEEQADAVAFYVSLFLYANVDIEDIYEYCNVKFANGKDKYEDLHSIMSLGLSLHHQDGYLMEMENLFPLLSDDDLRDHDKDVNHVKGYIPAFNKVCMKSHSLEDHMLWSVAYHINISRNFLKNKPWKQTQELTDVTRYDEQLVLGFIKYMGYLAAVGFTAESLYNLFYKKHRVNKFRQSSGY